MISYVTCLLVFSFETWYVALDQLITRNHGSDIGDQDNILLNSIAPYVIHHFITATN